MADDKKFNKDGNGSKKKQGGSKHDGEAKGQTATIEKDDELIGEDVPKISLFIAVGMSVGTLIIGLIGGYMVAPKSASNLGTTQPAGSSAPALSPDQLKNNQLPASHPPIPGMGDTSSAPAAGGEAGTSGTAVPQQ